MKTIIIFSLIFTAMLRAEPYYRTGDYFDTSIAWDVIKKSTYSVPTDFYNIATTPFKNPLQTLGYLGIIGALVVVDKPVTTFYQESVEEPLDFYGFPTIYDSQITHGADSWLVFGTMAHYLGGFALGSEKSQVTSIMAMKAITYSYVISHLLLKAITGRNRPKDDLKNDNGTSSTSTADPYDFGHLHSPTFESAAEGTAMPSFHVTMYFSVAKVYQEMYDNYWLPYTALAIIFASDIKGHNHWVSDMVAGGIVGTFIGTQIVSSYKSNNEDKTGFSLVPLRNGLALSYTY